MVNFFLKETRRDRLTVRASAMAFNFVLATFPGMLFLFGLLTYIRVDGLERLLIRIASRVIPGESLEDLESRVSALFDQTQPALLAIGFTLAFFFSTNGVNALIASFNKQHPGYLKRTFWQVRGASVRLTAYIVVLFIGSLLLIIGGRSGLNWLEGRYAIDRDILLLALAGFRWLVIFLLYFGTIGLIYHYGPARKSRWRFITPGATLASIMSILATLAFGFFASRFRLYNEIYGSIGALIIFMIWMNINTFVLLVGFELNNAISVNLFERERGDEAAGSEESWD